MKTRKRKAGRWIWLIVIVVIIAVAVPRCRKAQADPSCIVDTFISIYNEDSTYTVSNLQEMDINGSDYRTEFRLSAFSTAVGKKGTLKNGILQIVNYGNKNEYLRIYATVKEKETAVQLAYDILHILDPSLSSSTIRKEIEKDYVRFVFGSQIQGYIQYAANSTSQPGYDVFIDCQNVDFYESN